MNPAIPFFGEINRGMLGRFVDRVERVTAMPEFDAEAGISIIFHSEGGGSQSAVKAHDFLQTLKFPTQGIVDYLGSMGIYAALGCSRLSMFKDGLVEIHQIDPNVKFHHLIEQGENKFLLDPEYAKDLMLVKSTTDEIWERATQGKLMSIGNRIKKDLNGLVRLNAEECLELNLIRQII